MQLVSNGFRCRQFRGNEWVEKKEAFDCDEKLGAHLISIKAAKVAPQKKSEKQPLVKKQAK